MKRALRSAITAAGLEPLWFRLFEWRRSRAAKDDGAPDNGLAVPPAYLRMMVSGTPDRAWFLRSGAEAAAMFAEAAADAGRPLAAMGQILDFGCGAGRIVRHMPAHTQAGLFGVDYNPRLVAWCAKHLPGTFARNRLTPPLAFAAGAFDGLYAFSVFTHLRRPTQAAWLAEFARVIAPGGLALVTFHDEDHAALAQNLPLAEAVRRDGFAILRDQLEGSNLMATFQTREAFADDCAAHFEVRRVWSSAETGFQQALAVLRR